jgi:hypothetical protein
MIRFSLRCDQAHRFDSWFGSGADFERLVDTGHIACAICGSTAVAKDLMAPSIAGGAPEADLSAPASPAEKAMAELRRRIEATVENVGRDFAAEARRIHEGEAPERAIVGEARPSEARALIEDGIPVAPLPWQSRRSN